MRNMPFTTTEADGVLRIVLAKDAGLHPKITQAHSHLAIPGAAKRVLIDFAHISILNAAIQGWIFRMISDGSLSSLMVANTSRTVLGQLRQMGLSSMIDVDEPTWQFGSDACGAGTSL